MKRISIAALVLTVTAVAWAPAALTQDEGARSSPVEAFYCNLKADKTMKDLMKVADGFSKWATRHDPQYAAWILTPQFGQFNEGPQFVWLGSHPSGNLMGKGLDAWQASGGDVQEDFNSIMTCAAHGLAASVEINAPDGPPGEGVVMFSECSIDEDSDWRKVVAAHKQYSGAMRSMGAKNSNWLFFPMLGGSSERDFDYWSVSTFTNWTAFFAAYELYINGGGWQKGMASLKDVADCAHGSASVWDAKRVHEPKR